MALLLHNAYLADSSNLFDYLVETWVIYHNPEKLETDTAQNAYPAKCPGLSVA